MARDLDMLRGVQPLVRGFVVECVTFELIRDFFQLPQVGHRAKRRFIHVRIPLPGETVSDFQFAGVFFACFGGLFTCVFNPKTPRRRNGVCRTVDSSFLDT
jgi:hypothetical protein